MGFRKRKIARISVDSDIEKGRNSDTEDSVREFDDDAATWNQSTNSYAVLQTSEEIMINHSTLDCHMTFSTRFLAGPIRKP